jgi:hypothetical protein
MPDRRDTGALQRNTLKVLRAAMEFERQAWHRDGRR